MLSFKVHSITTSVFLNFPTQAFHINERSLLPLIPHPPTSRIPAKMASVFTPSMPTLEARNKPIYWEYTFQHLLTA